MTSRVSSKNKEKRPKEKIVKKKRLNRKKKNRTKKQKTASPGIEPGLSARASNSQLFEAGGAGFIMNSNILLRKISLGAYFKAISHYFGFNGAVRCRQSIELALLNSVEN